MKYGLHLPNFGLISNIDNLVNITEAAEKNGWDGIFLWDHVLYKHRRNYKMIDPWIALATISALTKKIKFGTMITPISRRRPQKLARECITLDNYSGGRFILGVGLGSPKYDDFDLFGDVTENSERGDRLDEGLDILKGFWGDLPFDYHGKYYSIKEKIDFLPKPVNQKIPIWVAGSWNYKKMKPFRRASKFQGCIPYIANSNGKSKYEVMEDIWLYLNKSNPSFPQNFDLVCIDNLPETNQRNEWLNDVNNSKHTSWILHSCQKYKDLSQIIKFIENSKLVDL